MQRGTVPPTILELLASRSQATPSKVLYEWAGDASHAGGLLSLTYGELALRSGSLARALLRRPLPGAGAPAPPPRLVRGDRVVLVFLPCLDFIVAFIACLRAGLVPVPCYPPDPRNLRVNVSLFASLCASSGARVALTHGAYNSAVSLAGMRDAAKRWLGAGGEAGGGGGRAGWPEGLPWWAVEELVRDKKGGGAAAAAAGDGDDAPLDAAAPGDLAFLQYTSGSTSEPKGVMITHGALAHNLATIVSSLRAGADTVVVSWLPQYHDMGLIGSYLGVLACGGRGVYASPLDFLKAPLSWLALASKHRATHLQAPNFAFALAARRAREAKALPPSLDLSCVRHAFNAAEPVTVAALRDFATAFSRCGFSPRALAPGYGLAENCVYVCDGGSRVVWVAREALETVGTARVLGALPLSALAEEGAVERAAESAGGAAGPRGAVAVVSCGPVATPPGLRPHPPDAAAPPPPAEPKNADLWVLVVNPATSVPAMNECVVGEVWTASPSLAAGYYGRAEATTAAFGARAAVPIDVALGSGAVGGGGSKEGGAVGGGAGTGEGGDASAAAPRRALLLHVPAPAGGEGAPPPPPPSPLPALPPPHPPPGAPNSPGRGVEAALRAGWLRTGDLGFIYGGELFLCGRQKDLVILRGRNFYPHDIEGACEGGVPALRPGCTAVFSVDAAELAGSGTGAGGGGGGGSAAAPAPTPQGEELVVVAEVREGGAGAAALGAVAAGVRSVLAREFGLRAAAILLLAPRGVRKTTSGKVARAANARAWRKRAAALRAAAVFAGGVGAVTPPVPAADADAPWPPGSPLVLFEWAAPAGGGEGACGGGEGGGALGHLRGGDLLAALRAAVAQLLGGDAGGASLSAHASLLELGVDSLGLAGLAPRLRGEFLLAVEDAQVFSRAFTMAWLVENADALRLGGVPLPPEPAGAAGETARREASYVETNCPCCLLCCGK
jgi:acyl-CoA synthetase (AMP-forming)/AMP-acid ligase II